MITRVTIALSGLLCDSEGNALASKLCRLGAGFACLLGQIEAATEDTVAVRRFALYVWRDDFRTTCKQLYDWLMQHDDSLWFLPGQDIRTTRTILKMLLSRK